MGVVWVDRSMIGNHTRWSLNQVLDYNFGGTHTSVVPNTPSLDPIMTLTLGNMNGLAAIGLHYGTLWRHGCVSTLFRQLAHAYESLVSLPLGI